MISRVKLFFQILRALPSSIIFCFYYLPLSQAYKLPILCYKFHFNKLAGKVMIDCKSVSFGMIKLGFRTTNLFPNSGLTWRNEGLVVFQGGAKIGNDSYLICGKKGKIVIGNRFLATGNFRIVSDIGITIGNNVLVGWGSVFLDTNFHPLYDVEKSEFKTAHGQITIGDGCWFAAQSMCFHSINIPDHCVFCARSIATRSISYKKDCLYGGSPIRLLKEGVRLDDYKRSINYDL